MAINLVSLVSQFLTPQMVSTLARALGVNEAVAQKVVAAAVPAILASLGTAAAAPGGAQKISDAISNSDPDILSKISQAASGGNTRFLNEGCYASERPPGRRRSLEPGRRTQPVLRRAAPRDPDVARRSDASGGRYDRSAGPIKLVGPFGHSLLLNSQKDAISAALPPNSRKRSAPLGCSLALAV